MMILVPVLVPVPWIHRHRALVPVPWQEVLLAVFLVLLYLWQLQCMCVVNVQVAHAPLARVAATARASHLSLLKIQCTKKLLALREALVALGTPMRSHHLWTWAALVVGPT